MKRKMTSIIALVLCLSMAIMPTTSVSAAQNYETNSTPRYSYYAERINEIDKKHDSVTMEILDYVDPDYPVIELNSIDELDGLLNEISEAFAEFQGQNNVTIINSGSLELSQNENDIKRAESVITATEPTYIGAITNSWNKATLINYLLLTWEIFIDCNVRTTYEYINPRGGAQFTRGVESTSWISGATVVRSWVQQGDASYAVSTTYRTKDTLDVELDGLYVLGMAIKVGDQTVPIGFSWTETWNCSIRFP